MRQQRIILSPISNEDSRRDFTAEFNLIYKKPLDPPMRWSGTKTSDIEDDADIFGFVLSNKFVHHKTHAIVLVYEIKAQYTNNDKPVRRHWHKKYKEKNVLMLGNVLAWFTWERYCELSVKEDGEHYKSDMPRGTQNQRINIALLNERDPEVFDLIAWNILDSSEKHKKCDPKDRFELIFKAFIKKAFPNQQFRHNKSVKTHKKTYRPDFLLTINQHVIIVEYDEKDHCTYKKKKEWKRLNAISDALDKTMIVIRFGNKNEIWENVNLFYKQLNIYMSYLINNEVPNFEGEKGIIVYVGYEKKNQRFTSDQNWEVRYINYSSELIIPPIHTDVECDSDARVQSSDNCGESCA